jgi:hypothetical protein
LLISCELLIDLEEVDVEWTMGKGGEYFLPFLAGIKGDATTTSDWTSILYFLVNQRAN